MIKNKLYRLRNFVYEYYWLVVDKVHFWAENSKLFGWLFTAYYKLKK